MVISVQGAAGHAEAGNAEAQHSKADGETFPGAIPDRDAAGSSMRSPLLRPNARLPRLDGPIAPAVRFRLDEAYQVAVRAIRAEPECAGLFGPFGVRGEEVLANTVYRSGGDDGACLRPALAFTCVGCRQTVLCSGFLHFAASTGAMVLIHEALHFAGLKEGPASPETLSSPEISTLVSRSCRF